MSRQKVVTVFAALVLAFAFVGGLQESAQADGGASTTTLAPESSTSQIATTTTLPTAASHDDAFVYAAYKDFLGRMPTAAELSAATAGPLDTVTHRSALVGTLAYSPEWIVHTVDQMYQDTLGREGDPSGTAFWVAALQSRRMTVAQVAANFYASSEYFNGFGNANTEQWIEDLYAKLLNRTPEAAGLAFWVDTTESRGRWWVAFTFFQSNESCRDRVAKLYESLLDRQPDAGGWSYWAVRVGTEGDLALAAHLGASPEYYRRAWTRFGSGDTTTTSTTSSTTSTTTTPATTASPTTTPAP